jgi:hypothetical protein
MPPPHRFRVRKIGRAGQALTEVFQAILDGFARREKRIHVVPAYTTFAETVRWTIREPSVMDAILNDALGSFVRCLF